MARMSLLLRASNEGLLPFDRLRGPSWGEGRPRVARAQETHRAISLLLAGVFSILLKHPFDGATRGRIQFSRGTSGPVCQPARPAGTAYFIASAIAMGS